MSFPLTYPDNGDPHFTGELIEKIAAVLTAHGYPSASNDDTDFADLRDALRTFLYGPEFDRGDEVVWFRNGKPQSGRVEFTANADDGLSACIKLDAYPDDPYSPVTAVVPCRDLTPIRDGAR